MLGALLVAQGAGKLLAPSAYVAALHRFDVFPAATLWEIALAWMLCELVAGTSLLVAGLARSPWPEAAWGAAACAVLLQLAYAALTFSATARGLQIANCTCFGAFFPQRLSSWVLLQDVYMIGYAGWQLAKIWAWPQHARSARALRLSV